MERLQQSAAGYLQNSIGLKRDCRLIQVDTDADAFSADSKLLASGGGSDHCNKCDECDKCADCDECDECDDFDEHECDGDKCNELIPSEYAEHDSTWDKTEHTDCVNAVSWSQQGMLISGSHDTTIKVWDANDMWDANSGTVIIRGTLREHNDAVRSVGFLPWDTFGNYFVSGGGEDDGRNRDFSIRSWTWEGGRSDCDPGLGYGGLLSRSDWHTKDVNGVCYSPDGWTVASCSDDRSVKIWNAETGKCKSTLTDSGPYGVKSISYSPAGDMIAAGCGNGKIHLLDTATFAVKRSLNGHSNW